MIVTQLVIARISICIKSAAIGMRSGIGRRETGLRVGKNDGLLLVWRQESCLFGELLEDFIKIVVTIASD